jgi:hypothetical protein
LEKKWKWIILCSAIVIIAGIIIWQIYSFLYSQHSITISNQAEDKETIIKTSPGEPLKNISQKVKENISTILQLIDKILIYN